MLKEREQLKRFKGQLEALKRSSEETIDLQRTRPERDWIPSSQEVETYNTIAGKFSKVFPDNVFVHFEIKGKHPYGPEYPRPHQLLNQIQNLLDLLNNNAHARKNDSSYARILPEILIEHGDIAEFNSDIIALKYAQTFYGADRAIASRLSKLKIPDNNLRPKNGKYKIVESGGKIKAPLVLFIGVPSYFNFSYVDIRNLAKDTLNILNKEQTKTEHLAMTLHGVGFGLDETECFLAEIAGFFDAFRSNLFPKSLKRITIVEKNEKRAKRLGRILTSNKEGFLEGSIVAQKEPLKVKLSTRLDRSEISKIDQPLPPAIENAGLESYPKPHIFVAMPFSVEFMDTYEYAIYNPISKCGFLCERVDNSTFTGDIMDYVKKKIEGAALVVAELTTNNPNVYLELGYAWGVRRPTILIAKKGEELKFDVRGQRVLMYNRIKDLENKLEKEINNLKTQGIIEA